MGAIKQQRSRPLPPQEDGHRCPVTTITLVQRPPQIAHGDMGDGRGQPNDEAGGGMEDTEETRRGVEKG